MRLFFVTGCFPTTNLETSDSDIKRYYNKILASTGKVRVALSTTLALLVPSTSTWYPCFDISTSTSPISDSNGLLYTLYIPLW